LSCLPEHRISMDSLRTAALRRVATGDLSVDEMLRIAG
jgi:hypothetical protein